MFSKEYLTSLAEKTGFRVDALLKQMTLLDLLREINRHPLLKNNFALKGGTAINLLWFRLPRLSVDIDLNYTGNADRGIMLAERPKLEQEMKKLIISRGLAVGDVSKEHAGAKWRLQGHNPFGGVLTLEVDLNYAMRVPVWGVELKSPYILDEDYNFECSTVSFEELFGGKIKALMDRSAARDLYDVFKLSHEKDSFDMSKLKKTLILFGITCNEDWRKKDINSINGVGQDMIDGQLLPMLRINDSINLELMKSTVIEFLNELMNYDNNENKFLNLFLDEGVYDPSIIFPDEKQAKRLEQHPAVLWKLLNHRKYLGLK
jgi:predicted nucleotidyltransferase component of viral defense system